MRELDDGGGAGEPPGGSVRGGDGGVGAVETGATRKSGSGSKEPRSAQTQVQALESDRINFLTSEIEKLKAELARLKSGKESTGGVSGNRQSP